MIWWSVLIEAVAPEGAALPADDDDRFDALADAVFKDDGVVSANSSSFSVRLSVEADDVLDACRQGRDVVGKAVANVGLPDWPYVRAEAVTHDELDAELAEPNFPALLGSQEAAEALGVSRQRLAQIRQAKPDFPSPVTELAAGPVWTRDAIDAFLETWERKPGRPPIDSGVA